MRYETKVRLALIALLVSSAFVYTYDLSASKWANEFYSMAVQAGTQSWRAAFFGSLDVPGYVTVDKPPASLWIMELSTRTFGLNPWAMLLPNAIEGVLAVLALFATVRRWASDIAGLIAAAIFAFTPVSILIFRYNNPDSLLVLLLITSAYCLTRAKESSSQKWIVATGALLGLAFLTKLMQAYLVVPSFALTYVVAAPNSLRRRVAGLSLGLAAMIATGWWWVAVVELWPKNDRPYYAGTPNNSVLTNVFGADGFNRILGSTNANGQTIGRGHSDLLRLFRSEFATQASWLLPAALGIVVFLLWRKRQRTSVALWSGWLITTGVVFSISKGIIHPYYSVAIVPAIAALVAIGAIELWNCRREHSAQLVTAIIFLTSGLWVCHLLGGSDTVAAGWFRPLVLVSAILATMLFRLTRGRSNPFEIVTVVALFGAVVFSGPAAYAGATLNSPHHGASPRATSTRLEGDDTELRVDLVSLMRNDPSNYRWEAATIGTQTGSRLQLAARRPVMALGGFGGSRYVNYSMPLSKFQAAVNDKQVHYFIAPKPKSAAGKAEISKWVVANFAHEAYGSTQVYDLSKPLPPRMETQP